jgi:PPM family protein phosphatase
MDSNSSIWQHCLQYAARSDVGLRRANNQDSLAVLLADGQSSWEQRGHVFLVADGMGAHAAGELASKMAADVVPLTYHKLAQVSPPQALAEAVHDANAKIHARGKGDPEFKGMGTTCTVMLLLPEGALVAHVGDSRAYRLRGEMVEQLTFDHSLVWELQQSAELAKEALPNYVSKNIITRSLGPHPSVQVDLEGPFPIQPGDTFLLCSDGLSGQVSDAEIGAVLQCLPPDEAADALVHLANLRGGPDNITVIVARVLGPQVAQYTDGPPSGGSSPARRLRPVHPLLWTLMGVFALGAAGLWVFQQPAAALVSLGAALVTGIFALAQRYADTEPEMRFGWRPLGKGPHRRCRCAPDAAFVQTLVDLCAKLRDAATGQDWNVDWEGFNRLVESGEAAEKEGDHPRAGREYLGAIRLMMAEIRRQPHADRLGPNRDSVLDP